MLVLLAVIVVLQGCGLYWLLRQTPAKFTVHGIHPEPGEILHVRVGMDLGGNQGMWLPTAEDVHELREEFRELVPEGVGVLITHCGVNCAVYHEPDAVLIAALEEDKLYAGTD